MLRMMDYGWWMVDGGWQRQRQRQWQGTFQLNSAFAKSIDHWCQRPGKLSLDTQLSFYAKFFQVLPQKLQILQLADLRTVSPKGWRCDYPTRNTFDEQLDTCRPFSSSLFVPERLSVGKEHCWVHRWKDSLEIQVVWWVSEILRFCPTTLWHYIIYIHNLSKSFELAKSSSQVYMMFWLVVSTPLKDIS